MEFRFMKRVIFRRKFVSGKAVSIPFRIMHSTQSEIVEILTFPITQKFIVFCASHRAI